MTTDSERLLAAEKTIRVLKQRVFDLQNGLSDSFQRQLERSRAREAEGRGKQAIVEARAEALARHGERLEAEVAERTRELKVIHDNVSAGFLLVDRDLMVSPGHTLSCEALLGPDLVGRALGEVLALPPRRRVFYELSVEQIFEDLLPEEVLVGQLERRVTVGERVLDLDVRVVRAEDGTVESLLYTLTDITALEEIEREARVNRMLLGILGDRESFAAFLSDARGQLRAAAESIEDQVFVRRVVHTIKGNAGAWGLVEVAETAHAVEGAEQLDVAAIERVESALADTLAPHAALLAGLLAGEAVAYQVTADRLADLEALLARPAVPVGALRRWVAEVRRVRLDQLLGPLAPFTEKLGERLGKRARMVVEGAEMLVLADRLLPVVHQLPHLIRNAVDHGLELDRGIKDPVGTLRLQAKETARAWVLVLSDDGAGVDLDELVEASIRRGALSADEAARLSANERLELLFRQGVSTAAEVTETSGRGVGMGAVRAAVRQAGGSISIASREGRGTTFTLTLPKPPTLVERPEVQRDLAGVG